MPLPAIPFPRNLAAALSFTFFRTPQLPGRLPPRSSVFFAAPAVYRPARLTATKSCRRRVFNIYSRSASIFFFAGGGGCAPFQPPPCFQAIHACDVFIMFVVGEGCAMGVLSPTARPPNPLISMLCSRRGPRRSEHLVKPSDHVTPPAFFKPAKACGKNSCHHHVCSRGRLCGSFICKWGCCLPLRPPPNPLVAMFAVGEGRADH